MSEKRFVSSFISRLLCPHVFPLQNGETALMIACEHGHVEAIEYLCAAGADVHALDKVRAHISSE
jgi:hypothetical protein